MRIEPPISVPVASVVMPAANAAPEPPDEPPGPHWVFQGLRVMPQMREWVTPEMPARPWTVYACTKLFGEALARYYSDTHGMRMNVIRLCWFQPYDSPLLREPGPIQREWCSPADLTQLLVKCLRADVPFAVFFCVSHNTGRFWDISNARELVGYEPVDDAAAVLAGRETR